MKKFMDKLNNMYDDMLYPQDELPQSNTVNQYNTSQQPPQQQQQPLPVPSNTNNIKNQHQNYQYNHYHQQNYYYSQQSSQTGNINNSALNKQPLSPPQPQQYYNQSYGSYQQQQQPHPTQYYNGNMNNYPLPQYSTPPQQQTSPISTSTSTKQSSSRVYHPTTSYPNLYSSNGSPRSFSRSQQQQYSPTQNQSSPPHPKPMPSQQLPQQYTIKSPYQQSTVQVSGGSPRSQNRQGAYQYNPNSPTVHYSPPKPRQQPVCPAPTPTPSTVNRSGQSPPPVHPYNYYNNNSVSNYGNNRLPPQTNYYQPYNHQQPQHSIPPKPQQHGYPTPTPSAVSQQQQQNIPRVQQHHQNDSSVALLPKMGNLSMLDPIPGAYGDGVHDDTLAVQNYFNNSTTNQIKIPPGTYLLTAPICISKDNIQLIGSPNSSFVGNMSLWASPPNSVGFINWKEYLFYLQGDNLVLDTINMTNICNNSLSASAILLYGSGYVMKNCTIDNFNQGLVFGKLSKSDNQRDDRVSYSNIKIINNKFTNLIGTPGGSICYGDGIGFFGCIDVTISNNLVSAKPGFTPRNGINSGPEGYCRSTNIKYHNNILRGDWDYPLTTEMGEDCILSNNDLEGSFLCGIIERGKNVKVESNKIHITGRANATEASAITFYGVTNGLIKNNTILGTAPFGIIVRPSHETGGGIDTVVEQNTIEGEFSNCMFMNNTTNTKIRGNIIFGKCKDSNGIHLFYAKGFDVHENNVDIPTGTACLCSGATDVNVKGNTMMTSQNGFYIGSKSANVTIEGNDLFGVTSSKFGKSDDSTNVTCEKNFGIDQ